jgi:FMN phosphatase YigB (HAD superfamily)
MLGAGPADVVFIDDHAENVAAAAALGIRGVHFSAPPQARTALAAHGVVTAPRG